MHHSEPEIEHIGDRLRAAREAMGLSVLDVEFRTRIPKRVVRDLEAADFGAFASPLYAKSFLIEYSKYLNVEADEWVDALEGDAFVPEGGLTSVVRRPETDEEIRSQKKHSTLTGFTEALPYLGFALLSLGLVGWAGYYVSHQFQEHQGNGNAAAISPPSPEPSVPTGTSTPVAPTPAEPPAAPTVELPEAPPRAMAVPEPETEQVLNREPDVD